MPNNNVAILSIMSKFDEKSAKDAAKKANKVYDEELSNLGNINFDEKLLKNFDKAMDLLKGKFKKVNLSSYSNDLLNSIFSDKDIKDKSADIENFIKKINLLKIASSGQDINAFNTFSTKQIDILISRTEKLVKKQEEINEKTREYNREADKIAKPTRTVSTIDKKYGSRDYSETLESLKKSLGTEKEFTKEQNESIDNLAKMVKIYRIMEKSEPQKGTAEAIRYSKDLLSITQKIKEERAKVDSFTNNGATKFIGENGFDSINKVNDYTINKAKEDFVKANLSVLKTQEAKLQSELTTYISDAVQRNLQKVTSEVNSVVDKAEKRVEGLQNKIDTFKSNSNKNGNNQLLENIVDDSQVKSLEEIEDRLLDLQDKYLEVDKNGYAVNDLDTKELKEFIRLYNQYISMLPKDNKFESDLPDTYKSIIDSDDELKKYADNVQKINKEKQKLAETEVKNNTEINTSKYTEDLKEQQQQIEKTAQAEKDLQEIKKVTSDTIINVDTEQALLNITAVKESLESLPSEKNIKISVNNTDHSSVPLLSNEEGKTVNVFRGVKNAWSGLVNDKGIGFFTDKLELAVDYADELAKDGKVIQANLSLHNPLEIEGNGARWDQIDFEGVKQKTDDIVEKAKQLGYDGVIFKNIRDGFTDSESDLSNVIAVFDAMQVKNEQVIGTVKAGTGELTKIESAANSMTDAVVESQEKVQSELKETQVQAEETAQAIKEVSSVSQESNISSGRKDAFPGSSTDTKLEIEGVEKVEKATEEAIQAKKDFATANEGVQSSIDGSKSPLQLEAELMDQIAKSAREAADAKKEFVEANKQVKDSAEGSNSENKKKDKYAKRNKISEDDFLNNSNKYSSIANEKLSNSSYTILGGTVNSDLIDGLVKVSAKVKDVDGTWKTFSARIDANGNMFEQRFRTITKGINNLDAELANLGKDEIKIPETNEQIQKFKELNIAIDDYASVIKRIANGKAFDNDEKDSQKLLKTINEIMGKADGSVTILSSKQLADAQDRLDKIDKTVSDITQKNIQGRLDKLTSYDTKLTGYDSLSKKFDADGWTSPDYIENVEAVRIALNKYREELNRLKKNPNLISNENLTRLNEYEDDLKKAVIQVQNMSAAQKGFTQLSGQKALAKINQLVKQNSNMSKKAKADIQAWYNQIASGNPSASLDIILGKIQEIINTEIEAGRGGKSMWDAIKEKAWYGAASAIGTYFGLNDIFRYGREIADTVIQLDTATTELRKVSDATDQRLVTNFENSAKTAKQLGSTISDVISATADWSRMGYDIDQAEELARVSTLYKNVGDGIDIETANNSLISTLQGFQLDASQAESIIDKFNEVANNYAIDSAGIGEALQRSAASFNAANTDLSKSIALITATNEVIQDPDSVGTLWKTMSARIRGAETELSELNEETDEYTKTTSKLRDLIKSLTGFDIMEDEDTFKDIYDIILGIGKEWNNLTDAEQSSLGEALAGKRNANALYAVLGNLDTLQSAYETAENSAGSAQREQENYQKSIQYSIDQTKAKLEELSNDLLSSDFLKGAIDAGGKLIDILDGIVKSGNAIPAVATAISAALSFKNVGILELY